MYLYWYVKHILLIEIGLIKKTLYISYMRPECAFRNLCCKVTSFKTNQSVFKGLHFSFVS